jgi:hypothetical protein
MRQLAPDLFDRRFQDLIEIGRAKLPSLAPDWTDHNAHDPGITLMELLAWVAEAQLYSLGRRPRRDERAAYASLLGLRLGGTQPARGLLWPDPNNPQSPAATVTRNVVIPADAVINVVTDETPTFRPAARLLWVPGRIHKLESRLAGGSIIDQTATNERGGTPFLPFGESAGRRDVLAMTFQCNSAQGLFGSKRQDFRGARWAIGVRVAAPLGSAAAQSVASPKACHSPLTATLIAGDVRVPLAIVSDSTGGLLSTGALLLDLDNVAISPGEFTVELRSPNGFPRPPRLLRIEPNVIPIEQGRSVVSELQVANGLPDFSFTLAVPGLRFAPDEEPLELEAGEADGLNTWRRCDRLTDRGPDERVYELDTSAGQVTFGNGVNGRIPPQGSQILVNYAVSDGEAGDVARNRQWKVTGFEGAFGLNPDPVTGGAAPSGPIDQRREARRRSQVEHALVSSDDIATAAKALPLLEVTRAWVLPPSSQAPRTGTVTLVVMRSRPNGKEPAQVPETARWLAAIRRRLVARIPLGTRLAVSAPRYVEFTLRATLVADAGRDPVAIKTAVVSELSKRLALVDSAAGAARKPGVPVTRRDIAAWLRAVDGLKSIAELRLVRAAGRDADEITVPRGGLPRFDLAGSTIDVKRPGQGSAS